MFISEESIFEEIRIWHSRASSFLENSWLSRDVVNFTGGQLKIGTQSLEANNFSLYVLTFCLVANMCNFVRFAHSSTV